MAVKMNKKITDKLVGSIKILFIIYILFLIYQIIRKELGGSWGFEELVIGLLIANLGYSFYTNSRLQKHLGKHSVLDKQFNSLCKDFKTLKEEK